MKNKQQDSDKIIPEQSESRDSKFVDLCISIDDFKINSILFLELVNNKIIDGTFSNIVYTDSCVIINSVYILLSSIVHKKQYIINMLISFEEQIIELYKHTFSCYSKKPTFILKDYFQEADNVKNFINKIITPHTFKLSGVWESKTTFGINHKFIKTVNIV